MALNPTKTATNPRIAKLIELEVAGRIKPEHQQELDTYRAQGVAPKKATEGGTESERTAAFLTTRVANGISTLKEIGDAGNPTLATEAIGMIPKVGNYAMPEGRQRAESAQLDVLDAALTLGTGAAYTAEQLQAYRKSYFPQIGDSDGTIEDKRKRLRVLLEAAKVKAGGSASAIDKALEAAGLSDAPGPEKGPVKTVAQDGITPLIDHLAGVNGPDAAPEFLPSGEVRIKHPDGTFDTYPSKLLYEQAATLGFSDNPTEQQRAEYKRKYGEEPGAISDAIVEGGRDVTAEDRDTTFGAVDAAVRGAADTVTLSLADELAAGATTLFGSGTMAENLRKERAIDRIDEKVNPYARMGGQLGGALLLPTGGARTPGQFAALGGGYGAGYGFGSGDSNGEGVLDRFKGAALGGGTGAALGWTGGTLADRIAARAAGGGPRVPPGGADAVALARAGQAEGVPLSRPILDPATRDRMAYLESSPGSGAPVRAALESTREGLETRAAALGGGGGTAQEGGALGQRIQDAGQRFVTRSRDVRNRMYNRAAQMAGDAEVTPTEALAALDTHIAELSRNANSNRPTIAYLNEIRSDLASGNKTLADMRDIRTNLRGNISQRNLMHTPAERIVGEVMDAARTDIQRDLSQSAPAAVNAYRRADRFNAQRSAEIRQVVQRVIGRQDDRLGGEQVMSRIRAMAGPNGDSARLQRMVDKLSPEERADYAATVAASLGRRSADEDFSPALFISSARGLSPAARRTIFGDDGARSIENLRLLSSAYRDTAARLNNSRSGQVANWGAFLRNVVGGGTAGTLLSGVSGTATGVAAGAALTGAGAAIRNLSARALMSPNMTRWLATAPRQTTPSAIAAHIARLPQIAARDPAIASEVTALQRALLGANDNMPVGRAAASGAEGNEQEKAAK